MPNAVLVVDMLKGFMDPGHNLYCGDGCREIISNIRRLLEHERGQGSRILFISDHHDPEDLEFQMFPVHCVKGTDETSVIPELADYVETRQGNVVPKNRYSGFFGTNLGEELEVLDVEKIIVCGVCTDICVLHTTADARNRDYLVEVPTDCVASFDPDAHRWALQHMEKILGAKLVSSVR